MLGRTTRIGFLDTIFFRRRKASRVAEIDPRMQQAIVLSRQEAITLAEQKLGRALSPDERAGIEAIQSLMMLESVCQSFAFPATTAAEVLRDVEYFATEATRTNAA